MSHKLAGFNPSTTTTNGYSSHALREIVLNSSARPSNTAATSDVDSNGSRSSYLMAGAVGGMFTGVTFNNPPVNISINFQSSIDTNERLPAMKEKQLKLLREKYSSYLPFKPDGDIASFTPGLFEEFKDLPDLNKDPNASSEFKVLLSGRGDPEDFKLKGYDIAVQAFAVRELRKTRCCLLFVGVRDEEQDEKAKQLLTYGIDKRQLNVRKFVRCRDKMKELLCEVDLVIIPSRTEGFGLIALEALSAGLPILVSGNSGFAQAMKDLKIGESFIVNSNKPEVWATEITNVQEEHREYIQKIKELCKAYGKKYSREEQCEALVEKMRKMVQGVN
ncbi:D-inositol 3-phosphate glycosyltransferase [Stylophora pistillata]|uniref:D-inositol 3-phosphate glycosyltransferase n=1 Tax=Stylophora pistillata TaxID=50429 RepID=A0A2B4RIY7_STYPI|nr:D-inositol 3-phosphate glycosyltransferase [Stylophora pistillata]